MALTHAVISASKRAGIAPGDLYAGEIGGTAFGNVLTPDAGKLHTPPLLPPGKSFIHRH